MPFKTIVDKNNPRRYTRIYIPLQPLIKKRVTCKDQFDKYCKENPSALECKEYDV